MTELQELLTEVGKIERNFRAEINEMAREIAKYCKIAEVDEGRLLAMRQNHLEVYIEWGKVYEYWRERSPVDTQNYVDDLQTRWETSQEQLSRAITAEYEKACRIRDAGLAEAIRATAALNLGRK
jgi:hypothetical protein